MKYLKFTFFCSVYKLLSKIIALHNMWTVLVHLFCRYRYRCRRRFVWFTSYYDAPVSNTFLTTLARSQSLFVFWHLLLGER
jgi:hypothetical protein